MGNGKGKREEGKEKKRKEKQRTILCRKSMFPRITRGEGRGGGGIF